ncbi:MAG TPA: hypothetical protein VHT75_04210 [Acidimicrobiales bacterium]|nr:hypothetical protein [Acidimicrobiales bacterium]
MSDKSEFYTEDGTWCCTTDHVTEPCGDCAGCDLVRSHNRALSRDPQWRRDISEAQLNAIEELCATASPVLTHPWKRDDAVAEHLEDLGGTGES